MNQEMESNENMGLVFENQMEGMYYEEYSEIYQQSNVPMATNLIHESLQHLQPLQYEMQPLDDEIQSPQHEMQPLQELVPVPVTLPYESQIIMQGSTPVTCQATCDFPSRDDFPGPYNFELKIEHNKSQSPWEYSENLKKAFVRAGSSFPVNFRLDTSAPPDLHVRAVAVYDKHDDVTKPVVRCPVHLDTMDVMNRDYPHVHHVIMSTSRCAKYEMDEKSKRYSVRVPLTGPQPGSDWQTIMFAMMCRSSCNNGIGRRPLALVFTLEHQCEVVGRRVLPLRSCALPKRDRKREEEKISKDETNIETENFVPERVKQEASDIEEEGDIGPLNGNYKIPVYHLDDYYTLIEEANELVKRDYPDGDAKQSQMKKYEEILKQRNVPQH